MLAEWNIELSSVIGSVTDGASNMKCAVKRHLNKKWFYCTPHLLHRAIVVALTKSGLRSTVLKSAKRIAKYFRSSNKAALEVCSIFTH